MKKEVLVLVLLAGMVSACYNITSMGSNMTYDMNFDSPGYPCLYFEDINVTFNFNATINETKMLNYSENYTNSKIPGLRVTAPAYPTVNLNRNLSFGENYTNTTLNLTIKAPDFPAINKNILLEPGQNYSIPNNGSFSYNFTCKAPEFPAKTDNPNYNANWSTTSVVNLLAWNESRTLAYNETWTAFSGRVTLRAPSNGTCPVIDCRQNISTTVTCGSTFTNPTTNITVTPDCKRNIDTSLNYSQVWSDTITNITCRAPVYPSAPSCMQNLTQELAWGDNYTNTAVNITVSCMGAPNSTFCYRNINRTLDVGEIWTDNVTNITVNALPRQNIKKDLDYNETWTNALFNITLHAPTYPRLNLVRTLNYSEIFTNLDLGIVLTAPPTCYNVTAPCTKRNVDTELPCGSMWNDTDMNVTVRAPACTSCGGISLSDENFTGNCTLRVENLTNNTMSFCADNLTSICSLEDLKSGDYGVARCVYGKITELNRSTNDCNNRLAAMQQTVQGYETGTAYNITLGNSLGMIIAGIGLIAVVSVLIASRIRGKKTSGVHEVVQKKVREESGSNFGKEPPETKW